MGAPNLDRFGCTGRYPGQSSWDSLFKAGAFPCMKINLISTEKKEGETRKHVHVCVRAHAHIHTRTDRDTERMGKKGVMEKGNVEKNKENGAR